MTPCFSIWIEGYIWHPLAPIHSSPVTFSSCMVSARSPAISFLPTIFWYLSSPKVALIESYILAVQAHTFKQGSFCQIIPVSWQTYIFCLTSSQFLRTLYHWAQRWGWWETLNRNDISTFFSNGLGSSFPAHTSKRFAHASISLGVWWHTSISQLDYPAC